VLNPKSHAVDPEVPDRAVGEPFLERRVRGIRSAASRESQLPRRLRWTDDASCPKIKFLNRTVTCERGRAIKAVNPMILRRLHDRLLADPHALSFSMPIRPND
jgi:hypothetical protein